MTGRIAVGAAAVVLVFDILAVVSFGGYRFGFRGPGLEGTKLVVPVVLLSLVTIAGTLLSARGGGYLMTRRRLGVILFVIFLAIYVVNDKVPQEGDTVPARYLPLQILRHGRFDFDDLTFLYARGMPHYLRRVNNHYVSDYPVGAALLALPFYVPSALGPVAPTSPVMRELEKLSAASLTAISAILLYFTLLRFVHVRFALWITIVYALGTSSFSQSSQALWQHGGSQLAITATLYCVTRTEWDLRWSVIAGFAGAFAIVCRPTDAILMACLTIFVLFRFRKNFVGFVAGALVPVGFQFWYNVTYLGGPFRTQFPVWGGGAWAARFEDGLLGILLSPGRGLVVYSPFVVLSAFGFVRAWRDNDFFFRCLGTGTLLTVLLYARWTIWWGGHSYGPRLLADLTPALALALAPVKDWIRGGGVRAAIFVGLAILSITAHTIGAFFNQHDWNVYMDASPHERLWSWTDNQLVNPLVTLAGRAIIALRGSPTSRDAAHLLWAEYVLPPERLSVAPGETVSVSLDVRNTGRAIWLTTPKHDAGVVKLEWRWSADGITGAANSGSMALHRDIFPGQSYPFLVTMTAPSRPGTYVVEFQLRSQGIASFSEVGVPPARVNVDVRAKSNAGAAMTARTSSDRLRPRSAYR